MSNSPVLLSIDQAVATVTLDRPMAGNAIHMELARSLADAATHCAEDPAVKCVVLTGRGKLFCGGGDIASIAQAAPHSGKFVESLAATLHEGAVKLQRMAKPLVVLVNGPAAGAGLSLAISGDIVIAARSAHFTAAYSSIGLTPDGGMSWILPRLVGLRRAQDMIIANRRIYAEEAAAIGLVTRVVDDADLATAGAEAARALAAGATRAISSARGLLLSSFANTLEMQLEDETRSIGLAAASPECREGVSAFLERRQPDFSKL